MKIEEFKNFLIAFFMIIIGSSLYYYSILQPINVEKNDFINIHYKAWISDSSKDYEEDNPIFNDEIWITVISIVDSEFGLILGLYNNIIGKEQF